MFFYYCFFLIFFEKTKNKKYEKTFLKNLKNVFFCLERFFEKNNKNIAPHVYCTRMYNVYCIRMCNVYCTKMCNVYCTKMYNVYCTRMYIVPGCVMYIVLVLMFKVSMYNVKIIIYRAIFTLSSSGVFN